MVFPKKTPSSYDIGSSDKGSAKSLLMFWKTKRYMLAFLAFFGFFNVYALRANMSIAIVAMTQLKNITLDNGTVVLVRDFDWDSKLQGYILSSFFYGYITTQFIGGYLATRFSGKNIFGMGIAVTAILTVFTPVLVKANVYLLVTARIIEGIFEGLTVPAIQAVWARWAPPLERTRLVTISFSGSFIGTVVAMPVCSLLASSIGWESIFYTFGGIGLIWCIIWILFASDSPATHKTISTEEREYILNSLQALHAEKQENDKIPWLSLITSLPLWAIAIAFVSETWGFYTLLTYLPKIMKNVLGFDLNSAGFMSALPYLAMAIIMQIAGQLADRLMEKKILSTTQVRKLFTCFGFLSQTVFILLAGFWLSPVGTTFCLVMAVGLGGFAMAGFGVNGLDIAPKYASILIGISNTFGTIPGIVSPILTGYLVTNQEDIDEWRIIFYISSSIYLFGALVYGFIASGELQPWAKNETVEKKRICLLASSVVLESVRLEGSAMALVLKRIYEEANRVTDWQDPRSQGVLFVDTPFPLIGILSLYLYVSLSLGPKFMQNRKPFNVKNAMIVYNVIQIIINTYMTLRGFQMIYRMKNLFCEAVVYDTSPETMEMVNISYMYMYVKMLDLADTLFFILRKNYRQVNFLHLYHHSIVLLMVWVEIRYYGGTGSCQWIGTLNSAVHAVMYSYYLLTSIESSWKNSVMFKRTLTQIQMLQFLAFIYIFGSIAVDRTCSFNKLLSYTFAIQNVFVFLLFGDFYVKSYMKPKNMLK